MTTQIASEVKTRRTFVKSNEIVEIVLPNGASFTVSGVDCSVTAAPAKPEAKPDHKQEPAAVVEPTKRRGGRRKAADKPAESKPESNGVADAVAATEKKKGGMQFHPICEGVGMCNYNGPSGNKRYVIWRAWEKDGQPQMILKSISKNGRCFGGFPLKDPAKIKANVSNVSTKPADLKAACGCPKCN